MKPFQLDTVLDYRKKLKETARNAYEKARKSHLQTKKQLAEKKGEHAALVTKLNTLHRQGISIHEHILYETRLDYLLTEIKTLSKELQKKQQAVIRERKLLILRSKEQQVMEKLKEKQNRKWQFHLDKKEAAMLDEFAILYRNH